MSLLDALRNLRTGPNLGPVVKFNTDASLEHAAFHKRIEPLSQQIEALNAEYVAAVAVFNARGEALNKQILAMHEEHLNALRKFHPEIGDRVIHINCDADGFQFLVSPEPQSPQQMPWAKDLAAKLASGEVDP